MKEQKRIVILTGAGAAYPWSEGKVTTKTITEEIKSDPFCSKIYVELEQKYFDKDSINFETIINAIERIFLYYRGRQGHFDSDFPALFCPKEMIKRQFPLYEKGQDKDQTVVDIVAVYGKIIETISDLIAKYDAILKNPSNEMNSKLCGFLDFISKKRNYLRSYTTNYDQMFIDVTKGSIEQLSFFDGFDPKTNDYDLSKILNSDHENCYLNLHGSIYWDNTKLLNSFGYKLKKANKPFSDNFNLERYRIKESNPSEPFIESPIITGFNKLQRINQEPFNAFANAFYRDCHKADIFIFIGFSFNDSHINMCLAMLIGMGKRF
jgi:hypothetical protein